MLFANFISQTFILEVVYIVEIFVFCLFYRYFLYTFTLVSTVAQIRTHLLKYRYEFSDTPYTLFLRFVGL